MNDAFSTAQSGSSVKSALTRCAECGVEIPQARRDALPNVRLCVFYQDTQDQDFARFCGYIRRSNDGEVR